MLEAVQRNKLIANRWFDAFNEKNLNRLLALYWDDAVHFSPKLKIRRPETQGLITGKAELASWWGDAFNRLPSLHYEPTTITADDTRVFMEYIRSVAYEEDTDIAEVLEILNDRIAASRVYHG